jgi:hypothetical protein
MITSIHEEKGYREASKANGFVAGIGFGSTIVLKLPILLKHTQILQVAMQDQLHNTTYAI